MRSSIAKRTWRRGFVHLTVDSQGMVSLWDNPIKGSSYLKLPLTKKQQRLIAKTMKKGGATP